ncbi:MAG TPA: TetR family transcriptional regulator [Nocardioidaceae bacterium]|nr:TetR family transcriptional regulator [Nocardioidaceae bacterium]
MTESDGRRIRGQRRRRQLIDAALTVLARDGLAGLTHRAVATEAGVPLASATYHFTGIDDLALSAVLEATAAFVGSIEDRSGGSGIPAYAAALARELSEHRGRVIAGYELYLLAARRPALREAATAWLRAGTDTLLADVDPLRRRAFLAAVDSVCLKALLTDPVPDTAEVEALLVHALR